MTDLLIEAKKGSNEAFEKIIKLNRHTVEKIVRYKTRENKEEINIIVNDIFTRVHNKLHTFSIDREFEPWLVKVAINFCNRYISERIKRNIFLPLDEVMVEKIRTVNSVEAVYISKERIENFISFIKKFKERDYDILYLRYLEAYSYEDIVSELNVPLHIVKNVIYKNKDQIKNYVLKI